VTLTVGRCRVAPRAAAPPLAKAPRTALAPLAAAPLAAGVALAAAVFAAGAAVTVALPAAFAPETARLPPFNAAFPVVRAPARRIQALVTPTVRRSWTRSSSPRPTASRWARRRSASSPEREPDRGEGDGDVVELAEDGDDARHEVDRRHEVAGRRDHRRPPGAAEQRVAGEAPGELQVRGEAPQGGGDALAREGIVGHGTILVRVAR
jgi:hypothetical protein